MKVTLENLVNIIDVCHNPCGKHRVDVFPEPQICFLRCNFSSLLWDVLAVALYTWHTCTVTQWSVTAVFLRCKQDSWQQQLRYCTRLCQSQQHVAWWWSLNHLCLSQSSASPPDDHSGSDFPPGGGGGGLSVWSPHRCDDMWPHRTDRSYLFIGSSLHRSETQEGSF